MYPVEGSGDLSRIVRGIMPRWTKWILLNGNRAGGIVLQGRGAAAKGEEEKKEKHLSILSSVVGGSYGRIYTGVACNFGARRVNTNVSLDNNIPVGSGS